jgi:hypothetical protein
MSAVRFYAAIALCVCGIGSSIPFKANAAGITTSCLLEPGEQPILNHLGNVTGKIDREHGHAYGVTIEGKIDGDGIPVPVR